MKILLLAPLLLASCSINPTIKRPDGTLITLGGSFMEDSDTELAHWQDGDQSLTYQKANKNQSKVAMMGIGAWGMADMAKTSAGVEKGEQSVTKAGISQRGATQQARIKAGTDATAIRAGAPLNPR